MEGLDTLIHLDTLNLSNNMISTIEGRFCSYFFKSSLFLKLLSLFHVKAVYFRFAFRVPFVITSISKVVFFFEILPFLKALTLTLFDPYKAIHLILLFGSFLS